MQVPAFSVFRKSCHLRSVHLDLLICDPHTDEQGGIITGPFHFTINYADYCMNRLKQLCIHAQYVLAVIALITYIIYWNTDSVSFTFALMSIGPLCIALAVFSICLLLIGKKDVQYWKQDLQLMTGALGLVLLHAALLIIVNQFHVI